MNDVLDAIRTRRSVRKYLPDQIDGGDLALILEAATWAPSGSNNQSWLFTAIQSPAALERLNALVRLALLRLDLPADEYPAKIGAARAARNPDFHFFYHAPTLIVASNAPRYANAMADCSLALQNMFLAAHSLGLGSCWINPIAWVGGDADVRAYLAELGVPREHVICGSAAVGRPDGPLPPAPPRRQGTVKII